MQDPPPPPPPPPPVGVGALNVGIIPALLVGVGGFWPVQTRGKPVQINPVLQSSVVEQDSPSFFLTLSIRGDPPPGHDCWADIGRHWPEALWQRTVKPKF